MRQPHAHTESAASTATSSTLHHVDQDDTHSFEASPTLVNTSRDNSFEDVHDRDGGELDGDKDSDALLKHHDHRSILVKDSTSISRIANKPSILEDGEQQSTSTAIAAEATTSTTPSSADTPTGKKSTRDADVTWRSLPKKSQLAVLTLARLSEPLSERSLSAYMFYQLRSFDPSLPDGTIASQGGMLTAAFAAAQFLTAVWWGRAADSPRIGRKKVLLIGLLGTSISSLGVGFSTSFTQAIICRAMAGALNGNIGVMRTMISEMIVERKYQSRAFLLLPMCFNIGIVIGPILGGFLADPVASHPSVFGPGSTLGGKDGVGWMMAFPYALPNMFSAVFITMSAMAVVLGLDETHELLKDKRDWGRSLGRRIARVVCNRRGRSNSEHEYMQVQQMDELDDLSSPSHVLPASTTAHNDEHDDDDIERTPTTSIPSKPQSSLNIPPNPTTTISPFRQILRNRNVILTISAHFFLALHISTFNALIFLFLPTPTSSSTSTSTSTPSSSSSTTNPPQHKSFLSFTGGLGLSPSSVGLATAIIGIIGLPLQLLCYPPLNAKYGPLKAYKLFLPFSALSYTFIPFLALLPLSSTSTSPSAFSLSTRSLSTTTTAGALLWISLTTVLSLQVLSRTFSLPSAILLVNNSSPSPSVLGTIHGITQSVSSAARTLGPTLGGWGLGMGLRNNCVGAVWWAMTGLVVGNWTLLWFIFEGDGRGGRA